MKKLLLPFFFALLLSVGACTDKDDASNVSVNGGDKFLSLDALARSGTLIVRATEPWTLTRTSGDDWLTLSATSGPAGTSEIEISLTANTGEARSATLAFGSGDGVFPFVVSQSALRPASGEADYYFYATFGTLPTLYAGLHVLSHDKPSYVFYARGKTFRPAEFPANATVLTKPDAPAAATDEIFAQMDTRMKRIVREINTTDPTATFALYVDDLRARLGYDWFVAQGIDSARVRVSLLSDGTATYNNFDDYFGNPATAESNWERYAGQVEALDWNHGGRYPVTRVPGNFESWEWPYYLSTRPGYRLLLQDKSLLESSGSFMTQKLAQMDAPSVQPYKLMETLTQDARGRFFRMAAFDYDRFAALFDASSKPNLIIIGTVGADAQKQYVRKIVQQYGTQYDIFFKPHPADKTSESYESDFPGLKLLPGQMPFEIFVWSLLDKIELIGGFPSTVFLTIPTDKVGFIFAPNAASLLRPLNVLFRDTQNVEWIQ